MNEDNKILTQIKQLQNGNVFTVPVNYFSNLPQQILLQIQVQKNTAYQIPNHYFINLSSTIITKIKLQNNNECYTELENIAPIFNTINKQNVYQVPANYFTNLPCIHNTKVVSIHKTKWLQYIAAASIVFIAFLIGINNNNKVDDKTAAQHQQVLKVNIEKGFATIADTDLNKTVETEKNNFTTEETTQTTLPFIGNVKEEVELITDEEIEFYLKNNNT